jgi:hypothetical protein
VRRGAASCQAVLRSCPGSASAHVVTAEPSSVAERRRRCNPSDFGPPSRRRRRRGRRGCPDAGHAVRRSVRRADVRPPGHADVQCPGDRCPRDRCDPGVRTDSCPVSAAAASALSGPRWIPDVGAADRPRLADRVRRVAVVSERLGRRCPNRAWPGRDGRTLAVRGSHEGRRHTWTAASQAHRRGDALAAWPTKGAGPALGAGRLAGSTSRSRRSQVPRRCVLAGCRRDARPWAERKVVTTLRGR